MGPPEVPAMRVSVNHRGPAFARAEVFPRFINRNWGTVMSRLKIEQIAIRTLAPYAQNARTHSRRHRANVMTKMKASSLSELVRMALLAGAFNTDAPSDQA